MSKIKDLSNMVEVIGKCVSETQARQATISADLYGSIKEVAELKYRMVEYETRLSNLIEMVKIIDKKGD